jgi:PIN domain nuclease of toxin-antitoxin system
LILLDTHIWLWWLSDSPQLTAAAARTLEEAEPDSLAISAISFWEVANKAAAGGLDLGKPVWEWVEEALLAPTINIEPITARIAVEAALLPGDFHKDPADRLIVATARVMGVPLLSMDRKITAYQHVDHA